MIGDFFTKPLGGAKFRRFRNIIMNISHDEHGSVDVDELTALHNEKMQRRIEMEVSHPSGEPTISKRSHVTNDKGSQECVGDVTKRTNDMWANIRVAHNNKRGQARKPTYAEVTAE